MLPADNDTSQLQNDRSVLRVGQILDGRFEIIAYLGCGGMGSVYKARQVEMDRQVALKILHPRFTADAAAVKRFQREAQIISGLKHTNILAVYAFGGVDGLLYLAMEFVQGNSLGQVIAQKGKITSKQAMPLLLQICDAMAYAHNNDVLHRDLKPDNVMVVKGHDDALTAKVVDFGLAKLLDSVPGQRLTRTGEVVGDPRYMSPQQCKGEKLDARDDVYSFGCLMYELLTGELPFEADDPVAIMHKQLAEDAKPFAKRLGLPKALEAITLTAMAKEKSDRYESFEAVTDVLTKFCETPDINIALPVSRQKRGTTLSSKRFLATACCAAVVLAGAGVLYANGLFDWSVLQAQTQYSLTSNPVEKFHATTSLADSYARNGDFNAAERLYKEAVALAVSNNDSDSMISAQSSLGRVYQASQKKTEASKAFSIALSAAAEQMRQKRPSRNLVETCKRTLVDYGKSEPIKAVQTALDLATACEGIQASSLGEELLASAIDVGPPSIRVNTNLSLARLNLRQKDSKDAKRYFDQAIELTSPTPARIECVKVAAAESLAAGDAALAAHCLEKEISLSNSFGSTNLAKVRLQLADTYFRAKDFRRARIAYNESAASSRSNSEKDVVVLIKALDGSGKSCLILQDFKSGEQSFRQELALLNELKDTAFSYESVDAHCSLGIALASAGRFNDALAETKLASSKLQGISDKTQYALARERVQTCTNQFKGRIQDEIAQDAMRAKNYSMAEKAYRTKLQLFKKEPVQLAQTHWSLADALTRSGRFDESLKELRNGLSLLPNTDDSQLATGLRSLIINEILLVTAMQTNERARRENEHKNHIKAEQMSRKNITTIQKIKESNASVRLQLHLAMYELGESLYQQERLDEAEHEFMEAIALMDASADKASELRTKISSSLSATRTTRKLLRRRSPKD